MYCTSVVSYNGAWQRLHRDHSSELGAIRVAVGTASVEPRPNVHQIGRQESVFSIRSLVQGIQSSLMERGWTPSQLILPHENKPVRLELDAVQNYVGIDVMFGKSAFIQSALLVKYPLFIKAGKIQIAIVLMPVRELAQRLSLGVSSAETIDATLRALPLLPVRYPFAIMGISDVKSDINVHELTSDLDQFLIEIVGKPLAELQLLREASAYDFKRELPNEPHKIAKEICALANCAGGGLYMVGFDDDGIEVGIPRDRLDSTKLDISNSVRGNCRPAPDYKFRLFDCPGHPHRCLLVVHVNELERKPCLVGDKVYIRRDAQAVAAKSEEIRRLLLGSA